MHVGFSDAQKLHGLIKIFLRRRMVTGFVFGLALRVELHHLGFGGFVYGGRFHRIVNLDQQRGALVGEGRGGKGHYHPPVSGKLSPR